MTGMYQSRDIVSQGTINLGTRGPRTFVQGHIVTGRPFTPPYFLTWSLASSTGFSRHFCLILTPLWLNCLCLEKFCLKNNDKNAEVGCSPPHKACANRSSKIWWVMGCPETSSPGTNFMGSLVPIINDPGSTMSLGLIHPCHYAALYNRYMGCIMTGM